MIIIMFKLLLLLLLIPLVFGLIKLGKFLFKVIDDASIKETKNDIEHKAELVDDVKNYTNYNGGKIEKSKSNIVEEFTNLDKN